MSYCGIYWDIQNVDIPVKQTPDAILSPIFTDIVACDDLTIGDFYIPGSYNTISAENVSRLEALYATFEAVGPGKDVADNKIKQRMEKFLRTQGSTVILITGDGGFVNTIKEFRRIFDATIYTVCREPYDERLYDVSSSTYQLENGALTLTISHGCCLNPQSEAQIIGVMCSEIFRGQFVKFSFNGMMLPPLALKHLRDDSRSGYAHVVHNDEVWAYFPEFYKTLGNESVSELKGHYRFNDQIFYINVNIETPPKAVVRLMICNDLRENKPTRIPTKDTLDMDQFKVSSTYNTYSPESAMSLQTSGSQNDGTLAQDWINIFNTTADLFSSLTTPSQPRSSTTP